MRGITASAHRLAFAAWAPWLLVVLAGAAAAAPGLIWGPGGTISAIYNNTWTSEVAAAFRAGEIYPRWLHGAFEGLGSPSFYFYPPMAFWLAGALGTVMPTPQAIAASGLVLLILSGLAMYAFLRRVSSRPLLGAVFYMLAPYHLLDLYVRGALAEFAAFVWMPLIALAIIDLPKRPLLLAVSFAALILTHPPATVLIGVFLIAPLAIWRVWREPSALRPGLLAGLAGLALAAFYLLPALTLQAHISEPLLWSSFYQPGRWSMWVRHDPHYLATLPTIGVGMAILACGRRSVWAGIALVAAFGALGLAPVMWELPLLDKVQFSWRLLVVVEFAAITALVVHPPRRFVMAVGFIVLLAPYIANGADAWRTLRVRADHPALVAGRLDAPEYLPRGFDVSQVTNRRRDVDLAPYRDLPPADEVHVVEAGTVSVRRNAFPTWRVVRDGVVVPNRGPLITFGATPGTYRIERVVIWQEWLGALISGLAAATLLVACALSWLGRRRGAAVPGGEARVAPGA